ncbi:hypothetical protein L0F63_003346 [Massospora cicadina]|nr:hypothetical protein L0F63_003346 [Massospora cicadina]
MRKDSPHLCLKDFRFVPAPCDVSEIQGSAKFQVPTDSSSREDIRPDTSAMGSTPLPAGLGKRLPSWDGKAILRPDSAKGMAHGQRCFAPSGAIIGESAFLVRMGRPFLVVASGRW